MVTSYARDVQLQSDQPSALDQHPGVKQYFDGAQQGNEALEQDNDQAEGRGAQMVEQDAPRHEMRPGPEIAQAQDRETFNEKWQAEQEAAREAALKRYEENSQNERSEIESELENSM